MAKKNKPVELKFWQRTSFVAGIIGLFVFACFLPAAFQGFINMDDGTLISNNALVLRATPFDLIDIFSYWIHTAYYKPLVFLSWIIEKSILGIDPHVIHFNNALIHSVNSALVFLLTLRLLPRMWPQLKYIIPTAALCALVWGVHPLRVESVAWAVERKDVLFGLFYLLACINYIKYITTNRTTKYLWFTALFFLLSCLSKSMGITFFAAAILIEFLFVGNETLKGKNLFLKLPLLLVGVVMLHLYGFILAPEETDTSSSGVLNVAQENVYVPSELGTDSGVMQFASIANFRLVALAAHTVLPVKLAAVYPREYILEQVGGLIYIIFSIPLFFIALFVLKKPTRSNLGFGLFWFVATISPVLAADGSGTNFLSDRYTYIPSLGIIWIVIPSIISLFKKPVYQEATLGLFITSVIVLIFTISTSIGIKHWKTSLDLWNNAIDHYPTNWYSYYNRAKLISSSDPDAAIMDLNKSISVLGNQSYPYYARGTLYMEKGEHNLAIQDFDQAIFHRSSDIQSRINRASCYRTLKQYQIAIDGYTDALSLESLTSKVYNSRGAVYVDIGKYQAAMNDYTAAIQNDPTYDKAYLNRANLLVGNSFGRFQEAIPDFTFYLSVNPNNHEARFRRGYAYAQTGNHEVAITDFTDAIAIHGTQGFYYIGRAQSFEQLGRNAEALADLQRAQQLNVGVDPAMLARLQGQ